MAVEAVSDSTISVRRGFIRKRIKVIIPLKNSWEFLDFQS